jgi:hypothetical protein
MGGEFYCAYALSRKAHRLSNWQNGSNADKPQQNGIKISKRHKTLEHIVVDSSVGGTDFRQEIW